MTKIDLATKVAKNTLLKELCEERDHLRQRIADFHNLDWLEQGMNSPKYQWYLDRHAKVNLALTVWDKWEVKVRWIDYHRGNVYSGVHAEVRVKAAGKVASCDTWDV